MPVIAFMIKSINAEKKKPVTAGIDVKSTPTITSVEEKEIEIVGMQPSLDVGFEFETSYNPNYGSIKFVGELAYATKDGSSIAKKWEKDGRLPEEVEREIKNFLFRKCLTLGINLSEELQLPPPIVFPVILPKNKRTG